MTVDDAKFMKNYAYYPIVISGFDGKKHIREIITFGIEDDPAHLYYLHLWTSDKEDFNDTGIDYYCDKHNHATCIIEGVDEI